MTYASHKAIGAATAVALGYDVVGVMLITIGSILPDAIDRAVSCGNQQIWARIHRTWSHWWIMWALLLYLAWNYPLLDRNINLTVFYLSIGSLLHIACDSLTKMGVPMFVPWRQDFTIGIMRTGSPVESITVAAITAALLYYSRENLSDIVTGTIAFLKPFI